MSTPESPATSETPKKEVWIAEYGTAVGRGANHSDALTAMWMTINPSSAGINRTRIYSDLGSEYMR